MWSSSRNLNGRVSTRHKPRLRRSKSLALVFVSALPKLIFSTRQALLGQLQNAAVQFVKHVCRKNRLPQSIIDTAGGKIFTYGSYRLGAYAPGSDIDTLVVAPRHVTREDFFEYMPSILERLLPAGAIEQMKSVPEAFVPIIKLVISGIDIDLNFTRLTLSSVPINLDIKDTNLLRGLDERELRALNGPRVADELVQLVPHTTTFRTALRAIKLWAQRQCSCYPSVSPVTNA